MVPFRLSSSKRTSWWYTAFVWLCIGYVFWSSSQISGETITSPDAVELELQSDTLEKKQSRPTKNITAFHITTLDALAEAEKLIVRGEYDESAEKLNAVLSREADLTPSEKAETQYLLARVAHLRQDFDGFVQALEKVLSYRENISYEREAEVSLRLSKLYFSQKKFERAGEHLSVWLAVAEHPPAEDLAFAGNFFAKLKDYKRAQQLLKRAIEHQKEAGLAIDPQWTELLESVNSRR